MILYFTGTGNSQYLAETMARRLHDTVVDATKLIKNGEHPHFHSEKPYVFVSPVYAWRLPRVFAEWMRQCRFDGDKRGYFILTCGSEIGAAGNYLTALAQKLSLTSMGTAQVIMPENYLVMFEPTAPEEDAALFSAATSTCEDFCARISQGQTLEGIKAGVLGHLCSDIVNPLFYTFYIGAKKFHVTDACISCGKCVESCMLNNIRLDERASYGASQTKKVPVWGKDCTHCMACICKCPTEVIEYGKKTKGRRRYFCTAGSKEKTD